MQPLLAKRKNHAPKRTNPKIIVIANGKIQSIGKKDDILPELLTSSGPCETLQEICKK